MRAIAITRRKQSNRKPPVLENTIINKASTELIGKVIMEPKNPMPPYISPHIAKVCMATRNRMPYPIKFPISFNVFIGTI